LAWQHPHCQEVFATGYQKDFVATGSHSIHDGGFPKHLEGVSFPFE